jgi:vacuolar protein sorting-associated protein 52
MYVPPNENPCRGCRLTATDEKDKTKFEDLHRSIFACDDILNSVEINLASFRNDLATVSAEIETLQARSTALSVRLENRKVVESGLGPVVEEISASPAVVRKIVDGAIDEAWVRALAEVEKRSKVLDTKSKESREIKGINDLKPLLENLVNKVGDPALVEGNTDLDRRSKESEISWSHRLRPYDLQISMHRLYSSNILYDTKNSMHFYTGITGS